MRERSTLLREELLATIETSINYLRHRLSSFQETSPEAQNIRERISSLQERREHLKDHYKKIDDLREEAAAMRETAQELRAELGDRINRENS